MLAKKLDLLDQIGLDAVPLEDHIGIEVRGLDLARPLAPLVIATLKSLFAEHLVMVFRGQTLDHQQHIDFATHFGELAKFPVELTGPTPFPELLTISNTEKHGLLGDSDLAWHSDGAFRAKPLTSSFLRSVEVPPEGGDTYFCNMQKAYERLDRDFCARLEKLLATHDNIYNSAGTVRNDIKVAFERNELKKSATHPLVMESPSSKKKFVYIGKEKNTVIEGLTADEGQQILDRVVKSATGAGLVYRHKWLKGDLVMWDNLATMHRRDALIPGSKRVMFRCSSK